MGLPTTQGMVLSSSFYWDLNEATRQWSQRFFARMHKMPDMAQAGEYSATMHYLQAVAATGTTETGPVMQKMRETPIHDFFAADGQIRPDGLMVHDMFLFQVKSPAESKAPWDYYKLVATVPGSEAFPPLSASRCPLVKR
jgi:branched-chain amino acid transport system substrate-binding protein